MSITYFFFHSFQCGDFFSTYVLTHTNDSLLHIFQLSQLSQLRPPFRTKSLALVGSSLIAGFVWTLSALYFLMPEINNGCDWPLLMNRISSSMFFVALFVRFYRFERIFVRHTTDMRTPIAQIVIFMIPFFPAIIMDLARILFTQGTVIDWDPETKSCLFAQEAGWEAAGGALDALYRQAFVIGILPWLIFYSWMVKILLTLRKVRAQFNEFKGMMFTIIWSLVPFVPVFVPLPYLALGYVNGITTLVFFWFLTGGTLYHLLKGDESFVAKFTYGFSSMPTPAELKASLEDQLSLPEVRDRFRQFAGKRFAQENLDFYEACLVRDELSGWFERQAKTMGIIDTFIRPGSEQEVNISDKQRRAILEGDINSLHLFEAAKREILQVMETDLAPEFQETAEMRDLASKADKEAAELAALQASGFIVDESAEMEESAQMGNQALDQSSV